MIRTDSLKTRLFALFSTPSTIGPVIAHHYQFFQRSDSLRDVRPNTIILLLCTQDMTAYTVYRFPKNEPSHDTCMYVYNMNSGVSKRTSRTCITTSSTHNDIAGTSYDSVE